MDFFDLALEFLAGTHNFVAAAGAAELEVGADAQHLPGLGTAGVFLLQNKYVSDTNIHNNYLRCGKKYRRG